MDIVSFREYCLTKPGVTDSFPFGEQTLVFKVLGKIFCLTNIEVFEQISLKCDPDRAVQLREEYPAVIPGYHLNKKHWNSILMDGSIGDNLIRELVDHSYDLVIAGMPKSLRARLLSS